MMNHFVFVSAIIASLILSVETRFFDPEKNETAPQASTNLNPSNYIVVYKSGVGAATVIETRRWSIGNLKVQFRGLDIASNLNMKMDLVDLSQCPMGTENAAQVLSKHPNVEYLELDQQVSVLIQNQPNPPTWGLDRIDQRRLPLNSQYQYDDLQGAGTTVYVVDTGVRVENPEFEGRAVWGADFTGEGFFDGNGHGTHCAGTVGSKTYGVAKKASIVAVKVLGTNGSGSWSNVITGINFVAGNCSSVGRRCVMSMSLGGGYSSAVNTAVQNAYIRGIVSAVAAGNANGNACFYSPSSVASALTVAATDRSDRMAWFSNFGPCVDINAPGVEITSVTTCNVGTQDCVATWSGTSMATPHVAGVIALVWSKESATLNTAAKVVSRIRSLGTQGVLTYVKWWTPNLLLFANP